MTTLLFLLSFLTQTEDPERLQTYVHTVGAPAAGRESPVDASFEMSPKALTVGDIVYAHVITKNISQNPVEYPQNHDFTLRSDRFFRSLFLQKNSSTDFSFGNSVVVVYGDISEGIRLLTEVAPQPRGTLQPEDAMDSYHRPLLIPPPSDYDKQFWDWKNFAKEEKILFNATATLHVSYTGVESRPWPEFITVHIKQELIVNPRPQEELQLIKDWYDKTEKFEKLWGAESPTAAQWKQFEDQLTPGTLRNYIRVNRTLVEIAQDENKGKRQEQFNEMLKWIDKLHPLEKEGLTKRAYEIVRENIVNFGNEIAVPAATQ